MITLMPSPTTTSRAEYETMPKKGGSAQWSQIVPVENQWQSQVIRAILGLASLLSNWDSYQSPPPSQAALATSIGLAIMIDPEDLPAPHVVPVPGGGIQFEWAAGQRELEFEILPDGGIEFLKVEHDQPIEEGQLKNSGQVYSLLFWLIST